MQTTSKVPIALDTSGRFSRDRALPALRPGTERVPGLNVDKICRRGSGKPVRPESGRTSNNGAQDVRRPRDVHADDIESPNRPGYIGAVSAGLGVAGASARYRKGTGPVLRRRALRQERLRCVRAPWRPRFAGPASPKRGRGLRPRLACRAPAGTGWPQRGQVFALSIKSPPAVTVSQKIIPANARQKPRAAPGRLTGDRSKRWRCPMTSEQFAREIVALTDTLYRVSYSILREACDREDAVQSCLEKAWKKAPRAARRALSEDVAGAHTHQRVL